MGTGIKTDGRHFADVFFRGGSVYTVDRADRVVSACAVRGDRIVGVGAEAELLHLVGPDTRVVDVEGKCLVPGLIDAHSHIGGYGLVQSAVDCKNGVDTIEEIVRRVAAAAARLPAGEWVRGRGYNQNKLAEGRQPNRHDLDRATADHPVALTRTCGHILACNSLALKLAGIDATTPEPEGGEIGRDEAGQPTGVLKEAACRPVYEFAAAGLDRQVDGYLRACEAYLAYGITSGHDASGGDPVQVRAMIEASHSGRAKLRTYLMLRIGAPGAPGDAVIPTGLVTGLGGPRIKLGPLKAMVDGSSSGPTAATREPYHSNPKSSGILYFGQAELYRMISAGANAGYQVTAHCVGDRAVEMMLRAIAGTGTRESVAGRRHRIEHCAMLDAGLIRTIRELGVVPIANPCFLWEFGDGYVKDYGPERAGRMFPLKALYDAGIVAAAGSDAPVTTPDPYLGIYCAMTRRTASGAVVGPEQAVGFDQALRVYTYNGAYASYEERVKGSIEPGKLADLAVVEPDLGKVSPEEIRQARALLTMVGGEVVHER
jgi:hypothetical protein